jgi:hypothetical protein
MEMALLFPDYKENVLFTFISSLATACLFIVHKLMSWGASYLTLQFYMLLYNII